MKRYTEIIRALREDKDLKQIDIANILNITQQQYSKYETGESELPLSSVEILASHYDVSIDFIMGRTACVQGIEGLNMEIVSDYSAGALISDVLSLDDAGRHSVIEYVGLQKLRQKSKKA